MQVALERQHLSCTYLARAAKHYYYYHHYDHYHRYHCYHCCHDYHYHQYNHVPNVVQAEADVDSLMEQVSQAETKNRSPFKRRSGLTDEEMGRGSHSHQAVINTFTHHYHYQPCLPPHQPGLFPLPPDFLMLASGSATCSDHQTTPLL